MGAGRRAGGRGGRGRGRGRGAGGRRGGRRFQGGGPVASASPLASGGLGDTGGNPLVGLYDYGNVPAPAPTNWRGSELANNARFSGIRKPVEPYSGPKEPAGGYGPGGPPPPRSITGTRRGHPTANAPRTPRTGQSSGINSQAFIPKEPLYTRPTWRQGYQEGGLASLLPPPGGMPPMPPMAPGMDEMSMEMVEEGPSPMGPGMEEIGMEEISTQMPQAPELGEEELVGLYMDARSALEGSHPNPEQAIAAFIEAFGEEAWIELQAMAAGGSDGMSDSIPGNIDGVEEVALSEGEYVVPSDVVSGIGNGDTNSGADRLKGMVEEIRTARTGAPGMPNQVDFEEIMGQV